MSKRPIENGGPYYALEIVSDEIGAFRKGRKANAKLEAIIDALLWKRDTKKDCRVYDAAGICIYDTALSNETLDLTA